MAVLPKDIQMAAMEYMETQHTTTHFRCFFRWLNWIHGNPKISKTVPMLSDAFPMPGPCGIVKCRSLEGPTHIFPMPFRCFPMPFTYYHCRNMGWALPHVKLEFDLQHGQYTSIISMVFVNIYVKGPIVCIMEVSTTLLWIKHQFFSWCLGVIEVN